MKPLSPALFLSQGFEIGYRSALARTEAALTLQSGTHFLLARNGRGKTTLLRTLAGSIQPRTGTIQSFGLKQYLPEDLRFDGEITPELIFRTMLPNHRRLEAMALAQHIELDVRMPYARLSTGNRRKTNLLLAEFSVQPDQGNILLLDEPFSGLDAFARQAFEQLWKDTGDHVLRVVSCHPDYDTMAIPNALLIENGRLSQIQTHGQTWNQLQPLLH
jgi:ABC-type multidrug transport system ATPase subunit